MTSPGDLLAFLEWDVRAWAKPLLYWSSRLPKCSERCRALEIGCGKGGLSLWLASSGFSVVCSDIGGDFTAARQLHEKQKVSQHIQYRELDATSIPYAEEFDVIIFKSVLGAVGRIDGLELQQQAINQMQKALKPGGILLFAENLKASYLHMLCRRLFVPWGSSWRYLEYSELVSLFSDFTEVDTFATGFFSAFGRREWQRHILARFDEVFSNHVFPLQSRYIGYGCAQK